MKKIICLSILASVFMLNGCAPEVGSKKWCENMEKKPKGEWTANDATEYAKSCIFRSDN